MTHKSFWTKLYKAHILYNLMWYNKTRKDQLKIIEDFTSFFILELPQQFKYFWQSPFTYLHFIMFNYLSTFKTSKMW